MLLPVSREAQMTEFWLFRRDGGVRGVLDIRALSTEPW